MNCPICAWSPENREYPLLGETEHWRVVLAPNQSLLGRCVLHLKRHAGSLAELIEQEQLEFFAVVRGVEAAVAAAFGAALFNWSCYLNHAYREEQPNPHVHWWAVPRYAQAVEFGGIKFEDPQFGLPYDHARWLEVSDETRARIAERIKEELAFEV